MNLNFVKLEVYRPVVHSKEPYLHHQELQLLTIRLMFQQEASTKVHIRYSHYQRINISI